MALGDRIRARREELSLSRQQLADRLGVTPSTVSNYEIGVSFPKEEVMLRLFDCLETDPNSLFRDSFRAGERVLTQGERQMLAQYRDLSPLGRESIRAVLEALPGARVRLIFCLGEALSELAALNLARLERFGGRVERYTAEEAPETAFPASSSTASSAPASTADSRTVSGRCCGRRTGRGLSG